MNNYLSKSMVLVIIVFFIGCKNSGDTKESNTNSTNVSIEQSNKTKKSEATHKVISSKSQACSYDGEPVMVSSSSNYTRTSSAVDAIKNIMKFTGLPQNFEVIETKEVPNAAAVILKDRRSGLPKRVIAYNPKFMQVVTKATDGNKWAPVSILAHEIGHHLCGHTILPGGSQPPTELEADKFSGFVLYKMGSKLSDAQKAMNTLVPDRDSPTHPRRSKRIRAIAEGWKQACNQESTECSGEFGKNDIKKPKAISKSKEVVVEQKPDYSKKTSSTKTVSVEVTQDKLPEPKKESIPTKFDKFVYDEYGILEISKKEELGKLLFDYAKEKNVEIVFMIVKDLNGMNADDFANEMIHKLRIGKLELGNGACLVVAPNQKQVGVGLMPGLQFEINENRIDREIKTKLKHFMNDFLIKKNMGYANSGKNAAKRIIDLTKYFEWVIKYENLEMILTKDKEERKTHVKPRDSETWLKLVRVSGTLESKNGLKSIPQKYSNKYSIPENGFEMEVKTADGKLIIVYATKLVEKLMTSKLNTGNKYSFVLRAKELYGEHPSFQLISYDLQN